MVMCAFGRSRTYTVRHGTALQAAATSHIRLERNSYVTFFCFFIDFLFDLGSLDNIFR